MSSVWQGTQRASNSQSLVAAYKHVGLCSIVLYSITQQFVVLLSTWNAAVCSLLFLFLFLYLLFKFEKEFKLNVLLVDSLKLGCGISKNVSVLSQ